MNSRWQCLRITERFAYYLHFRGLLPNKGAAGNSRCPFQLRLIYEIDRPIVFSTSRSAVVPELWTLVRNLQRAMNKHLPIWVGVLGVVLSLVWLYFEQLMGINFLTAILRSTILTLADVLFGGAEAGFFLTIPVILSYALIVGIIAALLCRVLISRSTRGDPHEPRQPN